jgi:hypothetical protein
MRGEDESIDAARWVHIVELGAWALCVMLGVGVLVTTLGADFPARAIALEGEAVALGVAVLFGGLSVVRLLAVERGSGPRIAASIAWITLRLSFGVPAFLFLLVASAAGFAA